LAVLSFNLLLAGVQVVPRAVLYRDMRFAELARIQVLGSFGGAAIAITLALLGAGVWALAAQPLVGSSVVVVASLIATRWRPHFEFSWPAASPLAQFSFPLLGIGLVSYTYRNADSVLVGRFIGAGPLGLYSMAIQLMLYPLQQVSSVFVQVLFPTLVKIQDDVPRMRSAYLRTVGAIALITFPMMGGLFAVADDFVAVVFGAAWSEMAPVLKVFALVGMMQSVVTTVGTIYLSTGRTGLAFRVTLIGAPLLIGGMAAGLPWGILGVAIGYAIASCALSYYSLIQAFRLIDLRLRQMFAVMARPFIAMIAMVVLVFAARWSVNEMAAPLRLAIAIATGIVAYGGFSFMFNRAQLLEIAGLLFSLRASRHA
jgi:PST family polysaccharide transporter